MKPRPRPVRVRIRARIGFLLLLGFVRRRRDSILTKLLKSCPSTSFISPEYEVGDFQELSLARDLLGDPNEATVKLGAVIRVQILAN